MEEGSSAPAGDGWLGKYRLVAELGHGGMADVYLGVAPGSSRSENLLVLKRLRDVEDENATAMFLDEARIAVRLRHPNVVRTYDVAWENDAFFISMEFLHGPTLQQLRRRAATVGGLPLRFELYILSQTLRGLQYAHQLTDGYGAPLRIIHRDFTPQNIIITHKGDAKILDFGIAKAADSAVQTRAGMYKGKLSYMPPEQLLGRGVDQRADIFAAGVMLYQALSGRALWEGADSNTILRRLAGGDVPAIRQVRPNIAPELVELCRRALAAKPDHRIASAEEMRRLLDGYSRFAGLRVTRDDLARYVQSLFGEERLQQEALIRLQLRRQKTLPPATAAGKVVGLPLLQLGGPGKKLAPALGPGAPGTVEAVPSIDVELTGDFPVRDRRWLRRAAAAALVIAALGGFFAGQRLFARAANAAPPIAVRAER